MAKSRCEDCPARFDGSPVASAISYPPFYEGDVYRLVNQANIDAEESRIIFGQTCEGPVEVTGKTLRAHLRPLKIGLEPKTELKCRFGRMVSSNIRPAEQPQQQPLA